MVIRGDNLEVLKILHQNYYGRIKMIYIDPPYNTKNDNFVYDDNFKISKNNLIEQFRLSDDVIDSLQNVYETQSHSGWLAFMYPRLKVARDILSKDGMIFISIDDNEMASLRIICDEIFGEQNYRNTVAVKRGTSNVQSQFKTVQKLKVGYETVLVYTKNSNYRLDRPLKPLNEERGGGWNNHWRGTDRPTMRYELFGITPVKGQWRWGRKRSLSAMENYINCVADLEKKNQSINNENIDLWYLEQIEQKDIERIDLLRMSDNDKPEHYIPPSASQQLTDVWMDIPANGSKKLDTIMAGAFDNPKSIDLLHRIMSLISDDHCVVLDFFAGSGTTGDAVMQLNAKDGGKRKFILVQNDEIIDKKKNKKSYEFCMDNCLKPVISSITLERLNRTGEKIKQQYADQIPDIGYKTFSLTPKPQIVSDPAQTKLFSIDHSRTETIDILINMLCVTGKHLDTRIKTIIQDTLYEIGGELYLLKSTDLSKFPDQKININGWGDINLEQYLNLKSSKDNLAVVY